MGYVLASDNDTSISTFMDLGPDFTQDSNPKDKAHYFSFIFLNDIKFSLNIQILNSNFTVNTYQFINSSK